MTEIIKHKVGELSPSQLLYSYGVGAIVDLPHISVMVSSLDDWQINPDHVKEIQEDRLLKAVKADLGNQVRRFLSLPIAPDSIFTPGPFEKEAYVGVPVTTFPRWMYCPACKRLLNLDSELVALDNKYSTERIRYVHVNCDKAKKRKPTVLPVRFLVACEKGHLDEFPWVEFVHLFDESKYDHTNLSLFEMGISGEARDLYVKCNQCGTGRFLSQAFGAKNRASMPNCTGRRPHLNDYDPEGCDLKMRAILLGASNLWFAYLMNSIALPSSRDQLDQIVKENWDKLEKVVSMAELDTLEKFGLLKDFAEYSLDEIWKSIEKKRKADQYDDKEKKSNLLLPEWQMFTASEEPIQASDFQLRPVNPPKKFSPLIDRVVLVERMREVRALVGFTRIDSPAELAEEEQEDVRVVVPISRQDPTWLPAIEVRGEGVFIQFNEIAIQKWLAKRVISNWENIFFKAHIEWRKARRFENAESNFPGLRYVLLHSFSHALMRQFALECGYTQASIRERIYSCNPDQENEPMAGILIYTSAPDSEGTLGGLVSLGEPTSLERHIEAALESSRLCASDPTCAEHVPGYEATTIHAAACHTCLFSPETSCERGNKYLDRSVLVETITHSDLAFFDDEN
jgi:hypothetical protein